VRESLLFGRERWLGIASLSGVVDPIVLVASCVMAPEARDELYPAETVRTKAVASLMIASLMLRAVVPLPNACDRYVFVLLCVCARVSLHCRPEQVCRRLKKNNHQSLTGGCRVGASDLALYGPKRFLTASFHFSAFPNFCFCLSLTSLSPGSVGWKKELPTLI